MLTDTRKFQSSTNLDRDFKVLFNLMEVLKCYSTQAEISKYYPTGGDFKEY